MHMHNAVLVEKILRVQPDVHKIYLLVRAIDEPSAKQRVQQEVHACHMPHVQAILVVFFIFNLHAHSSSSLTIDVSLSASM